MHHEHVVRGLDEFAQEVTAKLFAPKSAPGLFGTVHACVKAAYVAYRLCCIHPFEDGNGRVARLLINYVLMGDGLPFPALLCASAADRKQYMAAFSSSSPQQLAHVILQRVLSSWRRYSFLLNESILSTPVPFSGVLAKADSSPLPPLEAASLKRCTSESVGNGSSSKSSASVAVDDSTLRAVREHWQEEVCSICFEGPSDVCLLCCGRPFHVHCITKWFSTSQADDYSGDFSVVKCPQCRREFNLSYRIRLRAMEDDDDEDEDEETTDTTEEEDDEEEEETTEDTEDDVPSLISRHTQPECARCRNKRATNCTNFCCRLCCGTETCDFCCAKHDVVNHNHWD